MLKLAWGTGDGRFPAGEELLSEEGGFGIAAIGLLESFSKAFGAGLKRYTPTDFRNAPTTLTPSPSDPRYSQRNALTGSTRTARRAGM